MKKDYVILIVSALIAIFPWLIIGMPLSVCVFPLKYLPWNFAISYFVCDLSVFLILKYLFKKIKPTQ
jgi:hypothetical protein